MRLYYIINDFLNRQDYLNLDYFVETYKVSKRTIQNDIAFLMQVSSRKGYQLHMRRGKGYLLEVVNRQLLDEYMTQRIEYITWLLILLLKKISSLWIILQIDLKLARH